MNITQPSLIPLKTLVRPFQYSHPKRLMEVSQYFMRIVND